MQRALELPRDEKLSVFGVTSLGINAKPRSTGCLIDKLFDVGEKQPESQRNVRKSGVLMMKVDCRPAHGLI